MSTLFNVIRICVIFLGALCAAYIFWKKLKEDYHDSEIFTLTFYSLGLALASYIIVDSLYPRAHLWIPAMCSAIVIYWKSNKYQMRFFEVLEAFVPAFFAFIFFAALAHAFNGISLQEIAGELSAVSLAGLVYWYTSKNFRRFTWYPSGKLGISSLSSLAVWSSGRAILAMYAPSMLSFSYYILDVLLGWVFAILCIAVLYNRSGQDVHFEVWFRPKKKHPNV